MTIGFNHLGRHGRLGNQMFQYAGLRGIAAHKGYDFAIPPSDFNASGMIINYLKHSNSSVLQT